MDSHQRDTDYSNANDSDKSTSSCSTDRHSPHPGLLFCRAPCGPRRRKRRKRRVLPKKAVEQASKGTAKVELAILEPLCQEVWPALAVIGGVDGGLRIGGQCTVGGSSGGRKAMVLGMLKPGHTSLKASIFDQRLYDENIFLISQLIKGSKEKFFIIYIIIY